MVHLKKAFHNENENLSGAKCCALLLVGLAFSSSCTEISLGEWNSLLSGPCTTSISAILFMDLMNNDRND